MKKILSVLALTLGLSTYAIADTNIAVYVSVINGKAVISAQSSNGAAMFRISGTAITATNPVAVVPPSSTLVTSQTLGTLRNDYAGYAGFFVTNTSVSSVAVTGLGRWVVSGNSGTHTVYLLQLPAVSVVASVDLNTSGAPVGAYLYGSTNVTLAAGTTYAVMTTETSGGDQFYDSDTSITCSTGNGVFNGPPCYSAYINDTPTVLGTVGYSFGPLNIRY